MLRKIYLSCILLLAFGAALFAQNNGGAIKVILKDKVTGESIPFANVVAYQNGVQVGVATTNMEGEAVIKPLSPGKYDVKGVFVGYQAQEYKGVIVGDSKTAYITIQLSNGEGVSLDGVDVVEYTEPLVKDESGGTITREEYQNLAVKDVNSVAATAAGVSQNDQGGDINVRGGRSGNTVYFVDGVRILGGLGVTQQSVDQISVMTGGVPAMYGDATSGVIAVTTRGPQSNFFGNVELISSQLTDKFGYNQLGASVGGPIYSKKDTNGVKTTVLGYMVSAQGVYEKDPNPSIIPMYKLKDDKLKELEENPLIRSKTGSGFIKALEFVRQDDMERIYSRQNVATRSVILNGNVDFKPNDNTRINVGGALDYFNGHGGIYSYSLFNPQNNPQIISSTWRVNARLVQKFGNQTKDEKEKSQSTISNAYFTFLVSYEKTKDKTQDDSHKDNYFNYGYLGKFNRNFVEKSPFLYQLNNKLVVNGDTIQAWEYTGRQETSVTFESSDLNSTTSRYTSNVFDYYNGSLQAFDLIPQQNGLRNGDQPGSIYSMFNPTGAQYNGYAKTELSQFRITSSFSADIKKHAITVGVEFDQRDRRNWSLSPVGLWTRMRQLANDHITELDKANPIYDAENSGVFPAYYYNYRFDADKQTQFSKALNEKLGLASNSNKWINIDELDPSFFNIDMFSADDLLSSNSQNSLVDYMGYDHLGNKQNKTYTIDDFYTKKDGNGNFIRPINAFRPIYMAGYIQDKFEIKDLRFNIGVRIDRYDANQKVLKDKYLLQEAKTAGDVTSLGNQSVSHPDNIGSDYVVYVNDYNNPTSIAGYRNGNTWYDSKGSEVSDPNVIAAATGSGRVAPYLSNPTEYTSTRPFSAGAFTDYKPQINVMPRIGFSFPISDVANFFAHYDVLTQRPTANNRLNLLDFYFMEGASSLPFISNANLKPERTVDYELGFSQILNEKKNAALKITSFYREMRNQINAIQVVQAFPRSYLTQDNIDFSTVKGFTFEFDLRRTDGVAFTANYTLQFAEGSGSNSASGANLATSGQPSLRVTQPLDFDRRHGFVVNVDYRFGTGKDYKGPEWKRKKGDSEKPLQLLKDVGANLVLNLNSGNPYTRWSTPVPFGGGRSNIYGSLNGSNLPWIFRADLRVDKNIELKWGSDDDKKKTVNLNVYVQVFNVLNTKNILSVYNYTGNPDDDGYLTSPLAQATLQTANSPDSYVDLYKIAINNPFNYAQARQIRLGLLLDF